MTMDMKQNDFKKPLTIAVDGPVGAGKSTICDEVAKKLDIIHLDTGAMYRAVGLAVREASIDPQNEAAVCDLCLAGKAVVDIRYRDGKQATLLNGRDVSTEIREQIAGSYASAVSRYRDVRAMLVKQQQELAKSQDMLLDGRDICTVVLPDAKLKIYLTASAEERAMRRLKQLQEKGKDANYEQILQEVNARDHQDMNREQDPLRPAEDAVILDTTGMSFEESVQAIVQMAEEKRNA